LVQDWFKKIRLLYNSDTTAGTGNNQITTSTNCYNALRFILADKTKKAGNPHKYGVSD